MPQICNSDEMQFYAHVVEYYGRITNAAGLTDKNADPWAIYVLAGKIINDPVLDVLVFARYDEFRKENPTASAEIPDHILLDVLHALTPDERAALKARVAPVAPAKKERGRTR